MRGPVPVLAAIALAAPLWWIVDRIGKGERRRIPAIGREAEPFLDVILEVS